MPPRTADSSPHDSSLRLLRTKSSTDPTVTTTLTAVTPPGTSSTALVVVTTSFGSSTQSVTFACAAPTPPTAPAPTLASTPISLTSGPIGGGTFVMITGTNLTARPA